MRFLDKEQEKAYSNVMRLRIKAIEEPSAIVAHQLQLAEKEWQFASQAKGKYATSPTNPLIQ